MNLPPHELLIELLAIRQYEHDACRPDGPSSSWCSAAAEDRQVYRDRIRSARAIEDIYK